MTTRAARLRERIRMRHERAVLVANGLYGVIAVLAVLVGVEPGEATTFDVVIGGLAFGGIAIATKFFAELTKKETEMGARADMDTRLTLLRECLPTGAFAIVAVAVFAGAHAVGWGQAAGYYAIYYLGLATLFVAGFLTRFAADGRAIPAAIRGAIWLLLGLLILIGKEWV
jgi:hypothetical protein